MENPRHSLVTVCLESFVPLLDLHQPLRIEVHRQDAPNTADPIAEDRIGNPAQEGCLQHLTEREDLNGNANPEFQDHVFISNRPGQQESTERTL